MTARAALAILALGACGDNAAPRDAGAPDASDACTATFSGNFAEMSSGQLCATLAEDGTLAVAVPSMTLSPPLKLTVDLGASPSRGHYSSDAVASWSARGVQAIGNGVCVYNAGSQAVPTGELELDLEAIQPVHGTLQLTLYVLAFPGTDCGVADTESVVVRF